MADSILRLKVESQEYDNKLKQATNGLTRYVDECRKVGGTLEVVEKETLDYVRALGQMDTTSRTATGKLAEMKKAFTELSAQYKQMTDAEKQSPFGKALAASLDQLKGRIGESKEQLDDINKSINGGGGLTGALDAVAGKFGLSIDQITKFGGVVGAASAALKVSKDAFFASEQNIDEWGRVVASGESVYEGFLTALNTGDISGYLNNINTIINAAREAYNELDRLSTQKAIDNSRSKAQQTENERMRAMLRTGRYIAPNDGRKAAMAEGTILTDAQKQRIAQQLENGLKTANSIVRSEIDQTTKAINALYKEQASVLQMSSKEFRAGTSSMAEFDKRLEGYKNYVDFERQHTYYDGRAPISHRDNAVNPYEQYKAWGVFKDDGKLFQKINDLINQRASLQSQNYSNVAQAYRSINTATKPGSGGGGSRGGSGGGMFGGSVAYEEEYPVNRQEKLGAALRKLNDTELQSLQALGAQAERTGNEIAQVDKQLTRVLNGRQPGTGGGSGGGSGNTTPVPVEGSIDAQTKKVQELQKAWRAAADDDSRQKIKAQIEQAQAVLDAMNGKVIAPDGSLKALNEELAELNKQRELLTDPIDIELIDNQIKDVKDQIDQLNGKKVEIEIVPSTMTPFEQLKQSISIQLAEENMQVDETTLKTLMQTAIQNGIDGLDPNFASLQEKLREGMNIPDSEWEDLQTQINEKLKELGIEPINIDVKTGNLAKDGHDITKAWRTAASAISTVGSAMSGLKNPAIDIMTVIGQSIASIALAYAENLAGDKTTKGNIWAFIAAAAAATVSMATTIASIHSSTGYAQGGIVKGNSYSGDNVPALVDGSQMVGLNAGEVVLTRAMQSNLAGQLQNGGNRIQVVGRLSGEQLFLCAERWSKRTGKGEFVTWR